MSSELSPLNAVMTLARCRELLGSDATGLSDAEVDALRRHVDAMAQILVEIFITERLSSGDETEQGLAETDEEV